MPGLKYARVSNTNMKKLLVVLMLLVFTTTLMASEYSIETGKKLFIQTDVPAGKVGGGDFYSLNIEPAGWDYSGFSYNMKENGVEFVFDKPGKYYIDLIVNHLTKGSCAAVKAETFSTITLEINVSK